jgi:transposase
VENAAFVDVGSGEHWVCAGDDEADTRRFGAYTDELRAIRDWLLERGVEVVAMESTGVYWINLYQVLEDAGLEVGLVNARDLKYVKGRPKTDRLDCQWGRRLLSCGLLRYSFRPVREICEIRAIQRMRAQCVEDATRALQRMNKALCEMNLLLRKVVSDIVGVTGTAIIEAILAGERDPVRLAELRDRRIRKSKAEIARALDGHYRPEQLFLLGQAWGQYRFLVGSLAEYDRAIEERLARLPSITEVDEELRVLNRKEIVRAGQKSDKAPVYDAITHAHRICGVDLSRVPGIGPGQCLPLVLEIGTDMSKWPTYKHFCSWLGLSPNPRKSAGKDLGTRTKKCSSRAAAIFRQAASSVSRSDCFLGEFYRRMRAKKGGAEAITATAHRIAKIAYLMIARQREYLEPDRQVHHEQIARRRLKSLQRQAKKLGLELVPQAQDSQATSCPSLA